MTEYSGMKFALFFMAEYISMIAVGIIFTALYLGGYHFILVDQVPILGPVVFAAKVLGFLLFMIWVRATVPRFRYDRLMQLGWKVMMPLALLGVAWSAIAIIIGDTLKSPLVYLGLSVVFIVIVVVGAFIVLRPQNMTTGTGGVEVIDLENRHGLGYALLNTVGTLVSIPLTLVGSVQRAVGGPRNP